MRLGLYRREHLQSGDPALMGQAITDQFQRTHAAVNAWRTVEHTEDGHHTTITAERLDLAGDAQIHGDATVGGQLHAEGNVVVDGWLQSNSYLTVTNALPLLKLIESDQPANARKFRVYAENQQFVVDAINDAESVPSGRLTLSRQGTVSANAYTERARSVPMGEWQAVPYDASAFSATGGLVWAPAPANLTCNRYTLIGKTLQWKVVCDAPIGGTGTGGLALRLPGGFVAAVTHAAIGFTSYGTGYPSGGMGLFATTGGSAILSLTTFPSFSFMPTTTFTMWADFTVEIQ